MLFRSAAGLSDEPITLEELNAVLAASSAKVLKVLERVVTNRKDA